MIELFLASTGVFFVKHQNSFCAPYIFLSNLKVGCVVFKWHSVCYCVSINAYYSQILFILLESLQGGFRPEIRNVKDLFIISTGAKTLQWPNNVALLFPHRVCSFLNFTRDFYSTSFQHCSSTCFGLSILWICSVLSGVSYATPQLWPCSTTQPHWAP